MDAAVSLIADEVSSAAAARSSAFVATPWIDRAISSIAAAVWLTDETQRIGVGGVAFTEAVISVIDVVTCCGGCRHLLRGAP